jgi:hypothetical protein
LPEHPATIAAHADWSVDPRKRWAAIARREAGIWHLAAPVPVGDVATFPARLRAMADGGAVALGVDLPLGLPRAYAALLPERDFPHFLTTLATRPDFFQVCTSLAEVGLGRPFYPARGVAGMTRAAHALALGFQGAHGLSRACDRATAERPAGAPLFWTLGANQSGKAAIAAWRDMLLPNLAGDNDGIRLWPFAGAFRALLTPGKVALAETYPAEALRHLDRLAWQQTAPGRPSGGGGSPARCHDGAGGTIRSRARAGNRHRLRIGPRGRGSLRLHSGSAMRAERAGGQSPRHRARRHMDHALGGLGPGPDRPAAGLAHTRELAST